MSKIQEALGKIQKKRPTSGGSQNLPSLEDSIVVAKLIEREAKSDRYTVSSKVLSVDNNALRDAGLIAPAHHEELLANQYREIKRPLIAHAFGKRATKIERGNLIMVSSALSGEGKTFTSINLALSMAHERDHAVLLVDADVAKPHTSDMFGAGNELGLLDALENPEIAVQSLILPTDVENLSVLPAGCPRPHATELLASTAMENVCQTLTNLSDGQLVVIDSPPLLQTSEAKVLNSLAGQLVMVVFADQTPQEAVTGAIDSLGDDKVVNLVLNQARSGFGEIQYGYGYGYGYGKKEQKSYPPRTESSLFD